MGALEVASLFASIAVDDKASGPLKEVRKELGGTAADASKTGSVFSSLSGILRALPVAALFGSMIREASASQTALAQLDAVIKSTASANADAAKQTGKWVTTTRMSTGAQAQARDRLAEVTAKIHDMEYSLSKSKHPSETAQLNLAKLRAEAEKLTGALAGAGDKVRVFIDPSKGLVPRSTRDELIKLASDLQRVTRYSDETIIGTESMLMTFTKIGRAVMPQATEAVLNMATALGTDTNSAAVMLGKALNDPINGITALRRVGVTFSADQEKLIRKLMRTGDIAGAQKVILAELETEFGNSARAAGDTFAGKIDILMNKISDVTEQLGNFLLPILSTIIDAFGGLFDAVGDLDPGFTGLIVAAGALVLALSPIGGIILAIGGPVVALTTGIAALGIAWNNNILGMKDIAAGAWAAIKPGLDAIVAGVQTMFDVFNPKPLTEGASAGFGTGMNAMVEGVDGRSLGAKLSQAIQAGLPQVIEGFKTLLQGAWNWLSTDGLALIESGMKAAIKFVADSVTWVRTNAPDIIGGLLVWLGQAAAWLTSDNGGKQIFRDAVQGALNFTTSIVQFVAQYMPDLAFAIGGWIGNAVDWLFVQAPIEIQNAISSLFTGVSVDGSGLVTALGTVFGADGPIWALFDGLFGEEKGTIGLKVKEFFQEGGILAGIIEGSITIIQTIWDKLFGKDGGLMITINTLKGLVEGVFTALRASVMTILKGLLSPLVTLLKAVAIIADAIGNTELRAAAGKAALDIEGMKASGGPVRRGKNYIVGENGPEVFTPDTNGAIITNRAAFGGGSGMMSVGNINLYAVDNPAVMWDKLQVEANRRNIQLGTRR